jgi:hypothetical protein
MQQPHECPLDASGLALGTFVKEPKLTGIAIDDVSCTLAWDFGPGGVFTFTSFRKGRREA